MLRAALEGAARFLPRVDFFVYEFPAIAQGSPAQRAITATPIAGPGSQPNSQAPPAKASAASAKIVRMAPTTSNKSR